MKNLKVSQIAQNLKNVKIYEGLNDDNEKTMTICGDSPKTGQDITIKLRFSIAPCLQSMLSRGGHVGVSARVEINGVTVYYTSDLESGEKQDLGGWIADLRRAEKKAEEALHYTKLINEFDLNYDAILIPVNK